MRPPLPFADRLRIPVVGAPIGAVVNWRLLERLGETAMNSYRLRVLAE